MFTDNLKIHPVKSNDIGITRSNGGTFFKRIYKCYYLSFKCKDPFPLTLRNV